jgi:hypothetical protein
VLPRYPRLQTIIVPVGASDVTQWLGAAAPALRLRRGHPISSDAIPSCDSA